MMLSSGERDGPTHPLTARVQNRFGEHYELALK